MSESSPDDVLSWENLIYLADFLEASDEHNFRILGGEPTLHPRQVDRFLGIAWEEAGRFGLHPRTYIATNGAVSSETAYWLAARFDLVGISCDGPPEIQDHNRPGRDGKPLSGYVEHTMSTLKRYARPFHVRVTVSCDTVDRQAEIVSYLADCCI